MVERETEAIRDGRQQAEERHQAEVEMEQGLIAQKQASQRGTNVPIAEQADGQPAHGEDGEGVITAGEGSGDEQSGAAIGSPGAGTDPSETQTSGSGDFDAPAVRGVELEGDERTFEGSGRRSLDEQ